MAAAALLQRPAHANAVRVSGAATSPPLQCCRRSNQSRWRCGGVIVCGEVAPRVGGARERFMER